ncbi:DNA polymerase Y family protein [Amaricoccus solimangrovi]|uniref:DNA polymerase Y family protein n=1 Tax=Amaricoccus solimangrovi TaxID=2589815 RepID=A0A501WBT0_9RHOB|nr:DNA polymerase Y family protein [Amaricoccus solimangrovi]
MALFPPLLSADRIRASAGSPETPFALVEIRRGAARLAACDARARDLGLAPGMTLSDARARVPELAAPPHDPAADLRWLGALADFCGRYTPMVALDPEGALLLDITGCAHLLGGERALARDAVARLAGLGLGVRPGLAGTPEAARALARFGHGGARGEAEAIARLPVAALGLGPEAETALIRAGLRSIGDLAARPTAPVTARFGAEATARLDRLLGREESRITPRRPPPPLSFVRSFAEPIGRVADALAALSGLAGEAERALETRGLGGRRFEARFYRGDGRIRRVAVATGLPTRDPELVSRLIAARIEALADPLDPGFGFDALRLDVAATDPLLPEQIAAGPPEPGSRERAVAELVGQLSARFGAARVRRFLPRDSHVPERAALSLPALEAEAAAPPWPAPAEPGPPARPFALLARPEPVAVVTEPPDGAPARFLWRGATHDLARREGPERIAAEWWAAPGDLAETRDYYRVEDSRGRRFWLYRLAAADRAPRWFLHGFFA